MTRLLKPLALCLLTMLTHGRHNAAAQPTAGQSQLQRYITAAKQYSPAARDNRLQAAAEQAGLQRLKAMYTHPKTVLNADLLTVPIVSKDGKNAAVKWDAQDATYYYGLDLGESSSHLHAMITLTQPLLGQASYKAAKESAQINIQKTDERIRLEEHLLERAVTEKYLLCLLAKTQAQYADSAASLLARLETATARLAEKGMARTTDARLLQIERKTFEDARDAALHACRTHLMDLNLLCGTTDTTDADIRPVSLQTTPPANATASLFTEQYRLDSIAESTAQRLDELQYKPRLDLFVNGGTQTGQLAKWHRHIGWSAGLTLAWTLADGGQRRWRQRQTHLRQSAIQVRLSDAERQRQTHLRQCAKEIERCDATIKTTSEQTALYAEVIRRYEREMKAGQASVIDYLTVLKNKVQAERDHATALINRQLATAAYNYWNW